MVRLIGLLLACASCTWNGGRSDVTYACPDGRCPAGQECRGGVCEPSESGDACAGEARFVDEFEVDLDPRRWDVMADNGAVAHVVGGRLAIDYAAANASAEIGMIDRVLHDGATVTVEVVSPPDISSGFIRMRLFDDSRELAPLVFMADTTELRASIDSDLDVPQVLRAESYDPQRYRFWRIARSTDQICFSTSPDGIAFEEFACGSTAGVRSSLRAGLGAGNYANLEPQTVQFDRVTWCAP